MRSVAEVDALLIDRTAVLAAEQCALADSVGRVLRESVTADRDLPPHDRVTMDGIAVAGEALARGDRPLRIEGEARAGDPPRQLRDPGDGALRVMTGAVLPAGSDTVIRSEDLRLQDGRAWLQPEQPIVPRQNVHRQGSDTRAGTTVLAPGRRISPADIAVLASVGRAEVAVGRRPRVAVISTGDELVDVGRPIAAHQVRRSNIYVVATALTGLGYQVDARHLPDDPDQLAAGVEAALSGHDVLITTGAVSKGSADFLPGVYGRLGAECYLHGVRQRPGKPLWIGGTGDGRRVFALPGKPGVGDDVPVPLRGALPGRRRGGGADTPHAGRPRRGGSLPAAADPVSAGAAERGRRQPRRASGTGAEFRRLPGPGGDRRVPGTARGRHAVRRR